MRRFRLGNLSDSSGIIGVKKAAPAGTSAPATEYRSELAVGDRSEPDILPSAMGLGTESVS
jgi:hypothetical protein